MIKLKLITQQNLPNDNEYLWKYMDIHKFLDLINHKCIIFSRMDQFEDALEGIPSDTLSRFLKINKDSKLNLAQIIIDHEKLIAKSKPELFGRLDEVLQIQTRNYISCWFYEQSESMAMWNLYSNADGIALKVPFGKLKSNLKLNESSISNFICGNVNYFNYRKHDPYMNYSSDQELVALKKDISFSHEKEIRFVVKKDNRNKPNTIIKSEQINLKKLNLKVVCHPKMQEWKKNNIMQILKKEKLASCFLESEISLRY